MGVEEEGSWREDGRVRAGTGGLCGCSLTSSSPLPPSSSMLVVT